MLLASLIRAPNAGARTLEARARNLGGRLGWQISDAALAESLQCLTPTAARVEPRAAWAPHAARRLLAGRPPGTHLRSTLDARLQKFAFGQLARQVEALAGSNVRQGALLVLENRTGEVLAYASYTSQAAGTYVDGVQALRQTGSTLKPFLYATALDQRILTARSLLDDSPLDVSTGGGLYQPENYDASFHGPVSVRVALASSLNVPAVRTLALVGTEPFLKVLRQLGIRSLTESGGLLRSGAGAGLGRHQPVGSRQCLPGAGQRRRMERSLPDDGRRTHRRPPQTGLLPGSRFHRFGYSGGPRGAQRDVRPGKSAGHTLLDGRQDRHQQGHAGQLVHRLFQPLHGRRLDGKFCGRFHVERERHHRRRPAVERHHE